MFQFVRGQSQETKFTISRDLLKYLVENKCGIALSYQVAGHGCRNTPKVCVFFIFLGSSFNHVFQPCNLHRTPDDQPWIYALHLRTTFLVGEVIPLFVPTLDPLGDTNHPSSRESYLHFLACCTTSCLRVNSPLIIIFNVFLINEKLDILQPIPELTRNFSFRVKHQAGEYIPSVPAVEMPSTASSSRVGTLSSHVQAGTSASADSDPVYEPDYTYHSPPYAPTSPATLHYGDQAGDSAGSSRESRLTAPPNSAMPRRASKRKASSRAAQRLSVNFTT